LPQSQVLSYLANISTPTRVRRVARIGLRFAAAMNLVTASVILIEVAQSYVERYGIDIRNAPSYLMRDYAFFVFIITALLTCAGAQFFLGKAVEAGNSRACRWLAPTIFPNAAAFFVGSFLAAIEGFQFIDLYGYGHSPWTKALVGILCGALFLACAVGILLISDLSKFLQWIAKQPAAEKPPTPFLSGINQ
jgi:hypothetical protein